MLAQGSGPDFVRVTSGRSAEARGHSLPLCSELPGTSVASGWRRGRTQSSPRPSRRRAAAKERRTMSLTNSFSSTDGGLYHLRQSGDDVYCVRRAQGRRFRQRLRRPAHRPPGLRALLHHPQGAPAGQRRPDLHGQRRRLGVRVRGRQRALQGRALDGLQPPQRGQEGGRPPVPRSERRARPAGSGAAVALRPAPGGERAAPGPPSRRRGRST